jgi:hypothetical protein
VRKVTACIEFVFLVLLVVAVLKELVVSSLVVGCKPASLPLLKLLPEFLLVLLVVFFLFVVPLLLALLIAA